MYAARFVGGVWQQTQVVYNGRDTSYSIYNAVPVTALDGAGNGMIVFNAVGTLMSVKLNGSTGVFSTATPIPSAGATAVSMKMDAQGDAYLLLLGSVRRYDASTGVWGAPVPAGADQGDLPVLAVDSTGNAMVAWSSGGSIYFTRCH